MNIKSLYLDKLTFYWRLRKNLLDKNVVPSFLPFELNYDSKLELVIQKRNKKNLKYLDVVYNQTSNIGNIQEDNQWSHLYGKDFLEFLQLSILKVRKEIKKILEIGCGACILLEMLKNKGFSVTGIDPSPFSLIGGRKRGVKVIKDLFPSKKLKGKFDLIYSSDVLEHTVNPVKFLKSQREQLIDNGILIIAVPDNTFNIKTGDISIFLHQHLNYFDKQSLKKTVEIAGFKDINIQRSNYGGSLYCYARKASKPFKIFSISKVKKTKIETFVKKNALVKLRVKSYLDKIYTNSKSSLGFYAPLRALPYIASLNFKKKFRFFDDTAYWHMKYFDGINIPIENFDDLKKKPVTDILIMSLTFGEVIKKMIINTLPKNIRVKKLIDFLDK